MMYGMSVGTMSSLSSLGTKLTCPIKGTPDRDGVTNFSGKSQLRRVKNGQKSWLAYLSKQVPRLVIM